MKLISCHIDNFGIFHNFDMNFDESLNVIVQDNGWGKSTLAAFIRAMLYGFDNKRSKDLAANERKRYLPWQGGKYGGSLTFEKKGRRYTVSRTFGETGRGDRMALRDLDAGKSVSNVENVEEWLFKLDGEVQASSLAAEEVHKPFAAYGCFAGAVLAGVLAVILGPALFGAAAVLAAVGIVPFSGWTAHGRIAAGGFTGGENAFDPGEPG